MNNKPVWVYILSFQIIITYLSFKVLSITNLRADFFRDEGIYLSFKTLYFYIRSTQRIIVNFSELIILLLINYVTLTPHYPPKEA